MRFLPLLIPHLGLIIWPELLFQDASPAEFDKYKAGKKGRSSAESTDG